MEIYTETNHTNNRATSVRSTMTPATSYRSEHGQLLRMVTQIKQRYIHEYQALECIRCHIIMYTAMILIQLWALDQLKHSITVGSRPRMTPIGYQQYVYKIGFLVGQLKRTLTCECRMGSICRTSRGRVDFWERKHSSILQECYAAAVAHLDRTPGRSGSFPPILGDAEEEFEIAQDVADKEDCGEYLARWGGKARNDLSVAGMTGGKRLTKYVISRRMRDRWCHDEGLWLDEKFRQRSIRICAIRGKEWWNERMQSAD